MTQKNDNLKNNLNNYAKYSGLAFEMLGIIVLGTFGGIKLDTKIGTKPLFTIILSLGSIFASLYLIIKRVTNDK